MKLLIALRDVKTGAFEAPLTALTPGDAERLYGDILRNERMKFAAHPNDYPLYEIGKFDDASGQVYALSDDAGNLVPARLLLDAGQLIQLVKEG